MSCSLVIAHFRENLDWLSGVSVENLNKIYIYSKDPEFPKDRMPNVQIIQHRYLPNIGRESHTYLTHCINRYTELEDFTIFLQGDPLVHGISLDIINKWILKSSDHNFTHTKNYREYPLNWGLRNGRLDHWYTPTQKSKYNMNDWFKEYITSENIQKHRIYYNGIFGISKEFILSRKKEEYSLIINNELNTINPEAGHYMERSWYYLFNIHKLAKNE